MDGFDMATANLEIRELQNALVQKDTDLSALKTSYTALKEAYDTQSQKLIRYNEILALEGKGTLAELLKQFPSLQEAWDGREADMEKRFNNYHVDLKAAEDRTQRYQVQLNNCTVLLNTVIGKVLEQHCLETRLAYYLGVNAGISHVKES